MRRIVLLILTLLFFSIVKAQKLQHYLVFTFVQQWKNETHFCNSGDYLWIIPMESIKGRESFRENLIPLFAANYQINDLNDSVINNQSFGVWPIDDIDYKEHVLKTLKKSRKLVQKMITCYSTPKDKKKVLVYITPVSATCEIKDFSFKKKKVCIFKTAPLIWDGFWSSDMKELRKIVYCDFSDFDYVVSASN